MMDEDDQTTATAGGAVTADNRVVAEVRILDVRSEFSFLKEGDDDFVVP